MGQYDDMSLEDLKAEAAERNIEGRSTMNKAQLQEALEGGDSGTTDTDETQAPSEQTAEEFTDPQQHDPNYFGPSGAATGAGAGDPVHPEAGEGIPEDQRTVEPSEETSEQ